VRKWFAPGLVVASLAACGSSRSGASTTTQAPPPINASICSDAKSAFDVLAQLPSGSADGGALTRAAESVGKVVGVKSGDFTTLEVAINLVNLTPAATRAAAAKEVNKTGGYDALVGSLRATVSGRCG
jgi:hypothetical protein